MTESQIKQILRDYEQKLKELRKLDHTIKRIPVNNRTTDDIRVLKTCTRLKKEINEKTKSLKLQLKGK